MEVAVMLSKFVVLGQLSFAHPTPFFYLTMRNLKEMASPAQVADLVPSNGNEIPSNQTIFIEIEDKIFKIENSEKLFYQVLNSRKVVRRDITDLTIELLHFVSSNYGVNFAALEFLNNWLHDFEENLSVSVTEDTPSNFALLIQCGSEIYKIENSDKLLKQIAFSIDSLRGDIADLTIELLHFVEKNYGVNFGALEFLNNWLYEFDSNLVMVSDSASVIQELKKELNL